MARKKNQQPNHAEFATRIKAAATATSGFWQQADSLIEHLGALLSVALRKASADLSIDIALSHKHPEDSLYDKADSVLLAWTWVCKFEVRRRRQRNYRLLGEGRLNVRIMNGEEGVPRCPVDAPYIGWIIDSGGWEIDADPEEFDLSDDEWLEYGYRRALGSRMFPDAEREWAYDDALCSGEEPDFGVAAVFSPCVFDSEDSIQSILVGPTVQYLSSIARDIPSAA